MRLWPGRDAGAPVTRDAVLSVAWSILSSLGILVIGWSLVLVVVEVLFVGLSVIALLTTGREQPTSDPPDR